jgi:hypothetical protein
MPELFRLISCFYSFSPLGRCDASQKAGIAYMDVGKGREQERKLEGVL